MSDGGDIAFLSQAVQFLKGIGPRKGAILEEAGIRTIGDLLFSVPRRYLDRSTVVSMAELRRLAMTDVFQQDDGTVRQDATVVGTVRSFRVIGSGARSRLVLILGDPTGSLQCVWFGGVHYWRDRFRIGETLAASGRPSLFGGLLQVVHPDIDRMSGEPATGEDGPVVDWTTTLHTGGLVPLYASTQELARVGLDSSGMRRLIGSVLRRSLGEIGETLPPALRAQHALMPLRDALRCAHFPSDRNELAEGLRRLKYEELFFFQLRLAIQRHRGRQEKAGIAFEARSTLARGLVDQIPFRLTRAQVRVIREITTDMESPRPMNRLLQGDVGSGKTIVALTALLVAVDNGYQGVVMAPTEILAEQHLRSMSSMLRGLPVTIRLLVGAQRSRIRREVLEEVRSGNAQIVVGTHALFEEDVEFARLGLVVIDEQHRFGVMQRAQLRGKGASPDVLVMTATPIPRTLSMTLYGDLDVSVIDEMPAGRRPILTVIRHEEQQEEMYRFVREQVKNGRQAYFVYPLIEESEKLDLRAATVHLARLQADVFPDLRLGLLHGRMESAEKDRVMQLFKDREIDILVATTVIEVGIDIPNATVMVVENAERFGLSQLHQLRGRVGRGGEQSFCILMTQRWLARRAGRVRGTDDLKERRVAERRLAAMVETTDGFRIAEIDLALRGPGDYFGTRQSGVPEFRVADLITDGDLLTRARADAFGIAEEDPHLRKDDHATIARRLRAWFDRDNNLLRSG